MPGEKGTGKAKRHSAAREMEQIVALAEERGAINIDETAELLRIGKRKARRMLTAMVKNGKLSFARDTDCHTISQQLG